MLGLRALPLPLRFRWGNSFGKRLGTLWYQIDRSGATLARQNLHNVLGHRLSMAQIDAIALANFQYIAQHKLINDMLPSLTLQNMKRFLSVEGTEHLEEALARERGVILMTAHFGLQGYIPLIFLQRLGYQFAAVIAEEKEPDDSWVYRRLIDAVRRRPRRYLSVINPDGTPQRELIERLHQNHILVLWGDVFDRTLLELQPPHVLPAPLLGHTVPLKTGPFRLAHWLDVPVVPFFILPQGNNKFALVMEPSLPLSDDKSTSGLQADLAAFTARFEPHLLRDPALWWHWRHDELLELMQKPIMKTNEQPDREEIANLSPRSHVT